MFDNNLILSADSYKTGHFEVYPSGMTNQYAYIEPRIKGKTVTLFGLQMFLMRYLSTKVSRYDIEEAADFLAARNEPFNRAGWEHILKNYGGYLPLKITAVPEGLPIPSGLPLVATETNGDPMVAWLPSYVETIQQRAVWYPTTIASNDYDIKKVIAHYYRITGADMGLLPFVLHDFGARGVTSQEQAEIGGGAHLLHFQGTDNMVGARAVNRFYGSAMSGFSVRATEHSVECAYGSGNLEEQEYLNTVLTKWAKPGNIISIVIDGYDVYRAAKHLCTTFKDKIIQSGAKVVFRPDSGDMMEVVPKLLDMQGHAFGFDTLPSGYKKIRHVGLIQGDGINNESLTKLLNKVVAMGYSADNIVFGSGGGLLQSVTRDTYKFAQKTSAIKVDNTWVPISKDPITDPGKKSKAGRVATARSVLTGEYIYFDMDKPLDSEFNPIMRTVYEKSVRGATEPFILEESLDTIRNRCLI